jgi:hypothetical protein
LARVCSLNGPHETLVEFISSEEETLLDGIVSGVLNFGASLDVILDYELAGGAGSISTEYLDIRSILQDGAHN